MYRSVARGDLEAVKKLVTVRLLHYTEPTCLRPLTRAQEGYRVDRIIGYVLNLERFDNGYFSALFLAAWMGHAHIVSWLLSAGAHHDTPSRFIVLPVLGAFVCKDGEKGREIAELFPALPEKEDTDFVYAAARLAAKSGSVPLLELLADRYGGKWMWECYGYENHGCVHLAAAAGHVDMVEFLDGDPNMEDHVYKTPLMYACINGHADVVRVMIEDQYRDVATEENNGETPLSFAVQSGDEETIKIVAKALERKKCMRRSLCEAQESTVVVLPHLAYHGHSVAFRSAVSAVGGYRIANRGVCLFCACSGGHSMIAKEIIKKRGRPLVPIEVKWSRDEASRREWSPFIDTGIWRSPLCEACLRGHEDTVRTVITTAKVSANDIAGAGKGTVLHAAASSGNPSLVRYLVEKVGVLVSLPEGDLDDTALHAACRRGDAESVRVLVEGAGMDANQPLKGERGPENRTVPLAVARARARARGSADVATALLELGAMEVAGEPSSAGAAAGAAKSKPEPRLTPEAAVKEMNGVLEGYDRTPISRRRGSKPRAVKVKQLRRRGRALLDVMTTEQRDALRPLCASKVHRDQPVAFDHVLLTMLQCNCALPATKYKKAILPGDRPIGAELAQALATNSKVEVVMLRVRVVDGQVPRLFVPILRQAARAVNLKKIVVLAQARSSRTGPTEEDSETEGVGGPGVWVGVEPSNSQRDALKAVVVEAARPVVAELPPSSRLRVHVRVGRIEKNVVLVRTTGASGSGGGTAGDDVDDSDSDTPDAVECGREGAEGVASGGELWQQVFVKGERVRVRGDAQPWRVHAPPEGGKLQLIPEGAEDGTEARAVKCAEVAVARAGGDLWHVVDVFKHRPRASDAPRGLFAALSLPGVRIVVDEFMVGAVKL